MADEQHILRGVSWNEVFQFAHIFKSFRMAIHPSKMVLALLAIAITFVLGKWVMDPLWRLSKSNAVHPNEAWLLWYGWTDAVRERAPADRAASTRATFTAAKDKWLNETRITSLTSYLSEYPAEFPNASKMARDDFNGAIKALIRQYARGFEQAKAKAETDYLDRRKVAEGKADKKERKEDERAALVRRADDEAEALRIYLANKNKLEELKGPGIFGGFLDWQRHCLTNALIAVRRGNFAGGLTMLTTSRATPTPPAYRTTQVGNVSAFAAGDMPLAGLGLAGWLILMGWGLYWMASAYPVYSIIYLVLSLATWSIFGGAICRIAALHAAREEKISISTALRFSLSKFFSYFGAPLLPLAIIVCLGLVLVVGGLIGLIPYFGEWFVSILFFVALAVGMLMAFLMVGLVGGAPLMWPTIAVEGSDGFDAVSRSFSYTYARPFRYGIYWVVAALYGTACYLFVRLFAFLTLRAVHCWSGWAMGIGPGARDSYALGAGRLDTLWAAPTFEKFIVPIQAETLNGSEWLAAHVLNFWVYLVSGVVLAFLACYLLCASTTIYYLLRRKVDATDLDDVYVEEAEEQPAGEATEGKAQEPPASEQTPPEGQAPKPQA